MKTFSVFVHPAEEAEFLRRNPALAVKTREVQDGGTLVLGVEVEERLFRLMEIATAVLVAEAQHVYDKTQLRSQECAQCWYGYQA